MQKALWFLVVVGISGAAALGLTACGSSAAPVQSDPTAVPVVSDSRNLPYIVEVQKKLKNGAVVTCLWGTSYQSSTSEGGGLECDWTGATDKR